MNAAVVTGLFVYPLKSARGISLPHASVTAAGLAYDRQFMVIDQTGRFVSQREVPALACVQTALDAHGVRLQWRGERPGPRGDVLLPFAGAAPRVVTSIWRSTCAGDVIEGATSWMSEVCGAPVRVVRFAGERTVNPSYGRAEDRVQHADGYAVLVVNEASRLELEAAAGEPVPMDRFRANVVLAGWPSWAEDDVAELACGAASLRFVKPCGRCAIVSIDQATGARGAEPLRTLTRLRRDTKTHARLHASENAAHLVPFGENAVVLTPGVVAVGDDVRVALRR